MKTVLDYCGPDTRRVISAGTTLLTEGQRTGRIFVLADGIIEVLRGDIRVALVNDRGAIFGEMSVLLDTEHTATVRAHTDVTVHKFDNAEEFLRSDSEMAFLLARMLAGRLHAATGYLADVKRQYAGESNHLGMVSDVLASLTSRPRAVFIPGSDRQPDPET